MATRKAPTTAENANGSDVAASPDAATIGIGTRVLYRGEYEGEVATFYADVLALGQAGAGPTLRIHHPDGSVVVETNVQAGDKRGEWSPMQ